jgi:hypothetical protein
MEKFLKTRRLERTVISNFEGVLYGKEKNNSGTYQWR